MRQATFTLLTIFVTMPVLSNGTVSYSYEGVARSGPMAAHAVLNDWKGKFYKEDDGFLWQQMLSSVSYNEMKLSYVSRIHAEYRFPHQLAKGFYYATNDISLHSTYEEHALIEARDYGGYGWEVQYKFKPIESLSIIPKATWLSVNRTIWGNIDGNVSYKNPDEWSGRLEVDYGYTDDKILKRSLQQKYYGDFYGIGLSMEWLTGNYNLKYRGENLWAEIQWVRLPYTDAIIDTSANFILDGYEFYKKKDEHPSDVHWLNQSYQLSPTYQLIINSMATELFIAHDIGARRTGQSIDIEITFNPVWKSISTAIIHRNVGIRLETENIDTTESRILSASTYLSLNF